MLHTVIFMTSAANQEVVLSALLQVLFQTQVLHAFSLKKKHSQHSRQRIPMEEGFTSVTRKMSNVLFFYTCLTLNVHQGVQVVH